MAIAFDAGSNGSLLTNVTSLTVSHTCAGSDRILFVGVYNVDTPATAVSGITYNGVALTQVGADANGNHGAELWYLLAPDTGTHDIVVTMAQEVLGLWAAGVSLTGVNQAAPEASNTANGSSTTSSVSVTTLTDNAWVIDALGQFDGSTSPTTGANQTERAFSDDTGTKRLEMSTEGPVSPAGATTMSWTLGGSGGWAIVAAAVAPAATGLLIGGKLTGRGLLGGVLIN